jgi:HK97 family phage portal protein
MKIKNVFREFKRRASATWSTWFTDTNDTSLFVNNNTSAGVPVTADTAMQAATVFSCVRLLSDSVAQLPCKLTNFDETNRLPATGNPLFKLLLHSPNSWQTGFDYWKFNMQCLLLRGWFVSWVNKSSNGKILELIPLHPDSIKIEQTATGRLLFSGKGKMGANKTVTFDKVNQEQFFWSFYATTDGVTPCSPIKWNKETIGLALASQQHGSKVFANGANPSGVLTVPGSLDDPEFKRLSESWKSAYGGGKTGSVAILEEGTTFKAVSMSNDDAQYLETRQFQREDIAGIFGCPLEMIGDSSQAQGWNTNDAKGINFVTFALGPYLRRLEQSIRKCLIPMGQWSETEANFITQAFMRGDNKTRALFYRAMKDLGVFSVNDIRKLEDLNPRQDGDLYRVSANTIIDEPNGEENDNQI